MKSIAEKSLIYPLSCNFKRVCAVSALSSFLLLHAPVTSHAAELEPSDSSAGDNFGVSTSLSGATGLVGASNAAYVFHDLDTATGTVTQNLQLQGTDVSSGDGFGTASSLSGGNALIGASSQDNFSLSNFGAAYLFRDVDTATGTISQSAKLLSSDGNPSAGSNRFGSSVSILGNVGLVGADGHNFGEGAAYLFRNLDTATGTINENAKLVASDASSDGSGTSLGTSMDMAGNTALVGAHGNHTNSPIVHGAAYLFRDLDTATGTVTEHAKLVASDEPSAWNSFFGGSVSLSGNSGLVGAIDANGARGAAYLFRNLDSATGTVTENAILTSSDGALLDRFGGSASLDGDVALVGARNHDSSRGAVYLFRDMDTATGAITENLKLTASSGQAGDRFGWSISLDGDDFLIGANSNSDPGKAYTGTVSSMTILDEGGASGIIDGISFRSEDDWIIGQSTDNNTVTLLVGNTADVNASGKGVYIGQNAGSDSNTLVIGGTLLADDVHVGSLDGNTGNMLQLENTADFLIDNIYLTLDNTLSIEGDHTMIGDLLTYLDSTALQAWDGELWQTVDAFNYGSLIESNFDSGYTFITAIPEPSSAFLLLLSATGLALLRRRTSAAI